MPLIQKIIVSYEIIFKVNTMKIYFAGSIRGGREDVALYHDIILYLETKGQVFTEHVGDSNLTLLGEQIISDKIIFNRDIKWLYSSDIVIAEVTTPSLGVGYELGIAEKINKPILCLYRNKTGKQLSAMLKGNNYIICKTYTNIKEIKDNINKFILNL